MEAAEFLADEAPTHYWKFAEALMASPFPDDVQQCWPFIIQQGSTLLHALTARSLPLVLGARQYSPRVEMYRQMASQLHPGLDGTACCFADVAGTVVQDPSAVPAALASPAGPQPQVLPLDHVYNSADLGSKDAPAIVLYGALGTRCLADMHAAIKAELSKPPGASGRAVYVHRPLLPSLAPTDACHVPACVALGSQEQLVLPGWGVEAVLKNTEYSAMDDKKVKRDEAGAGATGGAGGGGDEALGVVSGFDLDRLLSRRPALRQELLTFRDHLQSSDEEGELKVGGRTLEP